MSSFCETSLKQEPSGKWTIPFVSHFEAPETLTSAPVSPMGLDAGLATFVTTSDGEKTEPPKFYRKQERKLRKVQRQHSRKQKGSRNKAKARKKVSVVHARIRHQRHDWLHKRSHQLTSTHDLICVEDLAISALVKSKLRGHSKSWQDASWGIFRRQLSYKQEWKGQRLIAVSRWYPSSVGVRSFTHYTVRRERPEVSLERLAPGKTEYASLRFP